MASAFSLRMSLQNIEASTLKKKKGKKMVSSSERLITSSDIGSYKKTARTNEKKHILECTREASWPQSKKTKIKFLV